MKQFIQAVQNMRRLQKQYTRRRDSFTLSACKKAEQEVDELLKKLIHEEQTPKLF